MSNIKLQAYYADSIVLGGVYNTVTKNFIKKGKAKDAGKHPKRNDVGGIDQNILQDLQKYGCLTMELHVPSGDFFIKFADFLKYSYSVTWKNPNFHFPRYYCPEYHWSKSWKALNSRVVEEEKEEALQSQELQQACLFGNVELQGIAQSERLL